MFSAKIEAGGCRLLWWCLPSSMLLYEYGHIVWLEWLEWLRACIRNLTAAVRIRSEISASIEKRCFALTAKALTDSTQALGFHHHRVILQHCLTDGWHFGVTSMRVDTLCTEHQSEWKLYRTCIAFIRRVTKTSDMKYYYSDKQQWMKVTFAPRFTFRYSA